MSVLPSEMFAERSESKDSELPFQAEDVHSRQHYHGAH